jgi:hypothetical protein
MIARGLAALGLCLCGLGMLALLVFAATYIKSPARGLVFLGFALGLMITGWLAGKCLAVLARN